MKHLLITLLTLAMTTTVMVASEETVKMKNGSIYMGHTSVKNFDDGYSSFMVDSAIVVVNSNDVTIGEHNKNLSDLSKKWQDWFRNRPELIVTRSDGKEYVTMCYVTDNNSDRSGEDVVLLERNDDYYKYWTFASINKKISDADVVSYEYSLRSPLAISGIIDELETTEGKILRGQIVRETPKGIGLFTEDKVIEVVPYNQIRATRKKPLFSEQPIDHQVSFLDVVVTHNDEQYEGILTAINYKPGDKKAPFYSLRESNGDIRTLPFKDVKEIKLRKNARYEPLKDIKIESIDEVYVNEVRADTTKFEVCDKHNVNELNGKENITTVSLTDNGVLKVTIKNDAKNNKVYLIRLDDSKMYQHRKEEFYGFTSNDLIEDDIAVQRAISPYGNIVLEYNVTPGEYLLYRPSNQMAYIIRIN